MDQPPEPRPARWVTRSVIGIVLATFFSDVGHEMATAILPLYLASLALGPAALGVMEGAADLLFSLSKLGGGILGHHVDKKRPWATLGYLTTALATGALALVHSVTSLVALRATAWIGRGFRSPLRDYLLSDEVGPTHFGRAYGIERAADMLGAVAGPLLAALLLWLGVELRTVILVSIAPAMVSVGAIFFLTRDRVVPPTQGAQAATAQAKVGKAAIARQPLPRRFWWFVGGVTLFGLGDFSRTFLIFLAATALGESTGTAGTLSIAVLLYGLHNAVSALAAYPAGHLGDRSSKLRILCGGYGLGVVTNTLLAVASGSITWLVIAIILSGVYIAVEETIEKATAAEMLPREQRSLGFGILASANAVGDMGSSLFVGFMLAAGHSMAAFMVPAGLGLLGTIWMLRLASRPIAADNE